MTSFVPFASRMMSSWQVASLIVWVRPPLAPQAQLRSLQSHRVAAPPPWLLGTGAEIVCRQAARRVERQRHQRLGQPPTSNRNSLRYPKSAGEPAGRDRRAGRANQPFGPIHPSCQADCAWIAGNDDESPPETPGLGDQSTGTGWEAPEIDSRDGRKPVLNYL